MRIRALLLLALVVSSLVVTVTACAPAAGDDDDDGFNTNTPTATPTPTGSGTPTPAATPPPNPFSNPVAWSLGGAEVWLKLDTNFLGNVLAWRVVDEVGLSCENTIVTTGFPLLGRGVVPGDDIALPWSIPDNDYSVPGCTPGNLRFDVDYNVTGIEDEYFEESFLVQSAPAVADAAFLGQQNVAANVHGFKGTTENLRLEMVVTEAMNIEFVEFYDLAGNLVFGCDESDNTGIPFPYPLAVGSGYQLVDVCALAAPVNSPFQFDVSIWGSDASDGTTFYQYIPNMTYDSTGSPVF